jgi:hypothetical protein
MQMTSSMGPNQIGIIYSATKELWVREAAKSAASVKSRHPELPIVLFTDLRVQAPCFDRVVVAEGIPDGVSSTRWHKDFGQKLYFLSRSPFERTLYLDSDTTLLGKLDELFSQLDKADFALAPQAVDADLYSALKPGSPEWSIRNPRNCRALEWSPKRFFNAGVLLYRRSEPLKRFFSEWWERWRACAEGVMDQDILNLLLAEGLLQKLELRLKILDNKIYNVRPVMIPHLDEKEKADVRILHSRVIELNEKVLSARREP